MDKLQTEFLKISSHETRDDFIITSILRMAKKIPHHLMTTLYSASRYKNSDNRVIEETYNGTFDWFIEILN